MNAKSRKVKEQTLRYASQTRQKRGACHAG
jgi:hypothetical protein